MAEITKPWLPTADKAAVLRNPEHWPAQVQGFLESGYGGALYREAEEARRSPDGSEHAPPHFCYKVAVAWCEKMDAHVSAYYVLPRNSFRDSALDRSAKDLPPKGGAA
jgi:hypothetical protein